METKHETEVSLDSRFDGSSLRAATTTVWVKPSSFFSSVDDAPHPEKERRRRDAGKIGYGCTYYGRWPWVRGGERRGGGRIQARAKES